MLALFGLLLTGLLACTTMDESKPSPSLDGSAWTLASLPGGLPAGTSYSLTTGFAAPARDFDLVLDMRVLARMGDRSIPSS